MRTGSDCAGGKDVTAFAMTVVAEYCVPLLMAAGVAYWTIAVNDQGKEFERSLFPKNAKPQTPQNMTM